MQSLFDFFGESNGRLPLLVGVILLYAAARTTMDALATGASAGARAIGHWIPIAVAAIIATLVGRRDLALAIIFSTSVASVSLVLGAIILVNPNIDSSPSLKRLWAFTLPTAMLPFLAGLSGKLTWANGLMMLIEGTILLFVWMELEQPLAETPKPAIRTFDKHYPIPAIDWIKELNIALYLAVATVASAAAVWGAWQMSQKMPRFWGNITVSALLSPILSVPMLVSATSQKLRDRAGIAVTGAIGVVFLNLCLLLPFVIWSIYLPLGAAVNDKARGLVFSIITWRVDAVVLVVLAFILLPIALGRWKPGRAEGATLIGLYALYVLMEAAAAVKS
jgi:Ca2+/Na+ antiporter